MASCLSASLSRHHSERGSLVRIRGAATISGSVSPDIGKAMVKAATNYCTTNFAPK